MVVLDVENLVTKEKKMINDEFLMREESYRLLGACFEVYNEQGFGLAEEIYQESLGIEFQLQVISNVEKPALSCMYKDRVLRKVYVPDFVVFDKIILELKAVSALTEEHFGQLLNYMRISRSPIGYLANFGKRGGLEHKRFVLSEYWIESQTKV